MTRWNAVGSGGSSINVSDGLPFFDDTTKSTKFRNDFLLTLAGYRNYYTAATTVSNQGSYAHYWSSSSPSGVRYLYFDPSYVGVYDDGIRADGFSVRCFQD
jgi:uncharacterized protein (TIGR02145 family)